ncbi:MAG: hypothetical protein BroJett040_02070 [Oligoflexia bacterium]|nr:MAG: hypothetical protein BroJett040_02070 [Oligoflexia bacterium]
MFSHFLVILLGLTFFTQSLFAEVEHTLLRRVAVFPIADANFSNSEDAWWQMRELLTKDQKLLVASRRFMMNRGVFQPRKTLKPADAIILGRLIDAQALVTTYLDERVLKMKVYEGENGYLLWEGEAHFHPAISINDQIVSVSTRLMGDFLASIPYQGYQVVDSLIGKPLYEKEGKTMAQVFLGAGAQVSEGDQVQWVKVTGDISQAFFNSATRVQVIAEGQVRSVQNNIAEVEITKMRDPQELGENSLVRFPKEVNRLKDLFSREDRSTSLGGEYLSEELKSSSDFGRSQNSTATALGFIANLAAFILIAF